MFSAVEERQNANLFKMKERSRHASIDMAAEYVRNHKRFRGHAGDGFFKDPVRERKDVGGTPAILQVMPAQGVRAAPQVPFAFVTARVRSGQSK